MNPLQRENYFSDYGKSYVINCNYACFFHSFRPFCQKRSIAPSIFNIKARGLAHCVLWVKLGLDEVYDVALHAVQTSNNDGHTKRFQNCKKLECLYDQNKSNETIRRLLINTVPAHMPIDEITIVRSFLCSL